MNMASKSVNLSLTWLIWMCTTIVGAMDYAAVFESMKPAVFESHETLQELAQLVNDRDSDFNVISSMNILGPAISKSCQQSTEDILQGLKQFQPWALSMLDAAAKPGSGILQGNIIWLGSYDQCTSIEAFGYQNSTHNSTKMHLFNGKYCSTNVITPSKLTQLSKVGLMLGFCIPDTCTTSDLNKAITKALSGLEKYNITAKHPYCHVDKQRPMDDTAVKAIIALLSVIGFILLIATLFDVFFIQAGYSTPMEMYKRRSGTVDYIGLDLGTDIQRKVQAIPTGLYGWLPMLMANLSLYTNGIKLFSTKTQGGSLTCIHGIRFLSMTWVVLGHTYVFAIAYGMVRIDNIALLPDVTKGFAFQAVLNAIVSVDTFFLISGTLVGYLLLQELTNKGGVRKINWIMFYFHRYWRLTPPYMIILGAHTVLFRYLGDGPMWRYSGLEPTCSNSWWANALYLNNLIPGHKNCMGWTWYLAVDMQYYIISPIFVIAFYLSAPIGILLSILGLLGTTIATAVIVAENHFSDTYSGRAEPDFFDQVYISPWCRFGPYVIGLILGYIIFKTKMKLEINWYLNALGWTLATCTAMAVLYGQYGLANGHPWSTFENNLYAALYRPAWAIAVGWVIFACVNGYGGPVNGILSWRALIPLSRLTYMAYLIHPVVIFWFYLTRRSTFHFDQAQMVWLFLGNLCITYGISVLCSLAFETPMMGLEKVIFKKKKESREPSIQTKTASE